MTRTAFLGAYGYGNLGDELCLIEAINAFPGTESLAFSVAPAWTLRCVPGLDGCFADGAAMLALRPDRVVFGGGMFGVPDAFRNWMPWLAQAQAQGAEIHFHNLGVSWLLGDLGWLDATARGVIAGLASFTVRDYLGVERIAEAGLGRLPSISFFPESRVPPDDSLANALLPPGEKLLGVSIIPTPAMKACLDLEARRIHELMREFQDHDIVPIVSTMHIDSAAEDDMAGATDFIRRFLPRSRIAAPALLDPSFWHAQLTPQRLKGLIARLDTLVTHRKHNAVHAIGSGVRVIGLHPLEDNSLRRTFLALSDRLPPGSRCLGLLPTSWRPA